MAKNGSRAYRWYKRYTMDQLIALRQQIEAENPVQDGVHYDGLYLYPKNVRAKFDDIAQAITWHSEDARTAAGEPVFEHGQYTGIGIKQNRH